jgi:hypothetical protein
MSERRVFPRKPVHILVLRQKGLPALGHSRDLSLGGIFVKDWKGNIGDETQILIIENETKYAADARIVRVTSEGTAFQFISPTDKFLGAVKRVIDNPPPPPKP